MSAPSSVLKILSEQTALKNLDCSDCEGQGERLVFDAETGTDYQQCDACQGSGYNLLGLIVHGLLNPPEAGFGPQALKAALSQLEQSESRGQPEIQSGQQTFKFTTPAGQAGEAKPRSENTLKRIS